MDMDTIFDSAIGTAPSRKGIGGFHKNRPSLLYRRIMHSGMMEPYRRLLHPLWVWTWKPHLSILSGESPTEKMYVNLKPPSTFALVMSVILGPLVFVMLLPLVLILVPVAIFVGVVAALAANVQCEVEAPGPHPLHLHVMD